jgi:hypothetical protein
VVILSVASLPRKIKAKIGANTLRITHFPVSS